MVIVTAESEINLLVQTLTTIDTMDEGCTLRMLAQQTGYLGDTIPRAAAGHVQRQLSLCRMQNNYSKQQNFQLDGL